ncbi:MAG: hypothetical protein HDR71_01895 [Lachnospiraceae bacterium]|nr:hypothetical protein [Lachnospiraceae bacterium]
MASEKVMTVSIGEILYYVFFSLLLLAKGIGLYDGQTFFKLLLVPAVIAWAAKMWLTEYTKKEFVITVLLLCLGGGIYLISGEKGALLYIFMITGLKNVPLKRVFAVGGFVWSVSFLGLTWLNALHLLEGPFKVHEKLGMGMIIRWGLGYSHPNVLHISYLVFVMFLVYLLGEKFDLKSAFFFMLGNLVIYIYSVSNTGVIAVTFYLLISLYWKYKKNLNIAEKILIQMAMPFCVLFSLLAPVVLQGKLFDIVNDISNTRLNLARHFLSLSPPTLFGVRLSDIITSQLTMDNSYVFAFVTYGTVLFAVIFLAYFMLVHKYCRDQKGQELCAILACLAAGVTEPFMFNTSFKNISLLFMKDILFEEEKKAEIHMPGYFYREYVFSLEKPRRIWNAAANRIAGRKKTIIIAVLVGCLVGALAYQGLKKEPERILVPEPSCDIAVLQRTRDSLESAYLSSPADVPKEADAVIGYAGGETKMIIYSGGIVKMEHIRGLVCSSITAGMIVAVIFMIKYFYGAERIARAGQGEVYEKGSDRK